ncbi:MSCRAMM family adhesin SdrC [Funiculus sociatus GB2-A5]|uniref:MSCRAMM family adhesin SdrC n=1 Tax=Funiculus sociatus GB2-A5 TaxID=2933946 RepID=A0ABV0JJM8_9CYAN|nr:MULTISPECIES: hypothetical protein [unclassified Trichocoleus]MBD1908379.1 hypothetical protein [Trichocoleus sp. FACHB-832]MBD2061717.1 hypothetical protein [Trichocoleus sp. FACHB-6]
MYFRRTASVISLTALAVVGSGFAALAETSDFTPKTDAIATSPAENLEAAPLKSDQDPDFVEQKVDSVATQTELPENMQESTASAESNKAQIDIALNPEQTTINTDNVVKPEQIVDKTVLNSASALRAEPTKSQIPEATNNQTAAPEVAQVNVTPGRATRSGPSYIGVAGNIGFGGDTTLSEGAFAVISKIGITRTLSLRPAALIGDDVMFLIPVTVDFPTQGVQETRFSVAPYVGGGVAISTGDDSTIGALITGGVDVPLSSQFTATAAVNVGFVDETEVGLLVGVGYTFSGL